jgi:sulfite exporter TauE/SafE
MSSSLALLAMTAAGVGILHTILGPDHYLPFVFMARAGRWSRGKTLGVTLACGLGHVLSSAALGAVGIALGATVSRLDVLESWRGELAAWALIAFGLTYFIWGLRRARRRQPHAHTHIHADGTVHWHAHGHEGEHMHVHAVPEPVAPLVRLTPWVLFTLFVFGPCEPLVPLLLYPAAQGSTTGAVLVVAVFGLATLATMATAVLLLQAGVQQLPLGRVERYTHALAGAALTLCGLAIQFLHL